MSFYEADDGRVFYRVRPKPGAPWLTLSHSVGGDSRMWDDTAASLAEHFQVLQYDIRGHGQTTRGRGPVHLRRLSTDVVSLWNHLGIASSIFVGLSLGGIIGIQLALHERRRIDKLVLCDCRAAPTPEWVDMFLAREKIVRAQGMAAVADDTLNVWFTASFRASHAEKLADMRSMIESTSAKGYLACVAAVRQMEPMDLRLITNDTLLIVGSEDKGAPPRLMQAMADSITGSRLVEIPRAAHIPNLEQPEIFVGTLLAFLREDPG